MPSIQSGSDHRTAHHRSAITHRSASHGLRRAAVLLCALAVAPVAANAQNHLSYHILNNGIDITYLGVGAGQGQTPQDGIGTWIPGESINGPYRGQSGIFPYSQTGFREVSCLFNAGPALEIHYPLVAWLELGGRVKTIYDPVVFVEPNDDQCQIFPLGGTGGFVPYGRPAGSTASFLVAGLPSGCGSGTLILPNENLFPSSNGGTATMLGCFSYIQSVASTGYCWHTQFNWLASVQSLENPANGWWHWVQNSPHDNQYWGLSGDELNLWQSRTVASDAGQTALNAFFADVEYCLLSATPFTETALATAPAGFYAQAPYYLTTAPINGINPNLGFDVSGHGTLSMSGTSGVPSINTGLAAQNPAGVGGVAPSGAPLIPTLGFWTHDGSGHASWRLTWYQIGFDAMFNMDPALTTWVDVAGGTVRVPSPISSSFPVFPQPLTVDLFAFFIHYTENNAANPDPGGFPGGAFGVPPVMGGSMMLPLPPINACMGPGSPLLCVSFGTTGLANDPPTPPGGLCFNETELGTCPSSRTERHYILLDF